MALFRPSYKDKKTGEKKTQKIWWYEFEWHGQQIRKSTKVKNKRSAQNIEAAHRTRLAEGRMGIEQRPEAPTLSEFSPRFVSAIETLCAEKPATVTFYKEKLRRLLTDRQLAGARVDAIDEGTIDGYKRRRTRQAPAMAGPFRPPL